MRFLKKLKSKTCGSQKMYTLQMKIEKRKKRRSPEHITKQEF